MLVLGTSTLLSHRHACHQYLLACLMPCTSAAAADATPSPLPCPPQKPSLPRAMFVPTGPAWGAFNLPRLFSQAGLEAPGVVQTEFLLQVLALYHTTYDNATVFDLTTSSVDTQAVVFSALGRAGKVTGATCPQRVSGTGWLP